MSGSVSDRSIPFRWPAAWADPVHLELLKDSQIGCVLDAPATIAAAAQAHGLTAATREQAAPAVHFLADPVWPGVRSGRGAQAADAGPTGGAWVNANGYSIRLARALHPGKPVWVEAVPEKDVVLSDAAYLLAIAESWVYRARWVLALDDQFAKALASRDAAMTTRWRKMMDALAFFEVRRQVWAALEPYANLVVISDFAGPNEFLGREVLNMADRRNLPYRIVPKAAAARELTGAHRAILFLDEQPCDPPLARALQQAVNRGALLIASPGSGASQWGTGGTIASPVPGYTCTSLGKGKIAVPAKAWDDPYVVASEARILMGRRLDVMRLYNTGSMAALYTRAADGRTGVVHLLNYTLRPDVHPASVAPGSEYARAQVVTLERQAPEPAAIARRLERFAEIPVPAFRIYSAVELRS